MAEIKLDRVPSAETVLLLVFLGVSVSMFAMSFDFQDEAALFPRFSSGVMIVCVFLLLFKNYLPGPLHDMATESAAVLDAGTDFEEYQSSDQSRELDDENVEDGSKRELDVINGSSVTAFAIAGYAALSYLIGMLWATPMFVFLYLIYFDVRLHLAIFLSALSLGIGFLFMDILNVAMDTGLLT